MHENICQQCNKVSTGPAHRLVRDSCGHEKCRVCLLEDENNCKQCVYNTKEHSISKIKTIKVEKNYECDRNGENSNEVILNNHTGVIQVNGNVPSTSNLNGDSILTLKTDNNVDTSVQNTPKQNLSEPLQNSSKVKKNIFETKTKKPDKPNVLKRSYGSILIPKHINVTLDPLSYHCTICNKTFTTKTHVKYHVYCGGASKPYKCEICGKEFILRAQLDVHSYKHKSFKPYPCTICKKSFSDRSKLARHSAVHSTVKSHICSICGNAYRSKESLKIHALIHKSEKPYACTLCNAKFSNQSNLNKHNAVHIKEKTHMCDLCGKRYKQKWALTVHKSSHIRGKIFECSICFKKFNYSKDLRRHSLIHVETKQYKCSICSTTFRRQDNLRRHMKNTHPGKKGEVLKNVSPSTCNILSTLNNNAASIKNLQDITNSVQKDIKPVDNPNAINVITSATPAFTLNLSRADVEQVSSLPSAVKSDSRAADSGSSSNETGNAAPTSVINGPIKLAFKTPAFKSHYNINRDFSHMPSVVQLQNTYNMAESVEICQKIMSTDTSLQPHNIIRKTTISSTDISQNILDSSSTRPLHYETSFQNKKHAMIKNIKFKVPIEYTNQFNSKDSNKVDQKKDEDDPNLTFNERRPASVIVNRSNLGLGDSENLHWRRRTLQNLTLKNLN